MPEAPMRFEAFDPQALADWLVASRADYVNERIAAGDSPQEAEANATRSFEQLVPGGSPAPGQLIGRVCIAGESVGHLWIGPAGSDSKRWWVWDIAINDDMRGHGLGRQAMLLGEQLARNHGATTIGLNVFGHNRVARALYTSLGYHESAVVMRKPL
jgi:ribosomal protein S18 acetylase RimI-like enzyme